MRLPSVPGPRDLLAVAERAGELVEDLVAVVPRVVSLVGRVEGVVDDVEALLARIERTRAGADEVVERTEGTRARADAVLTSLERPAERLVVLLDALEPSLVTLQPTIARLAETTDPREVDALVKLVDTMPVLADQVERDVLPVLRTLGTVAPDLHDLLDISRELNEMLGKLPGMGRIKKRVDEEQAAAGHPVPE